jgi:hypothetical protein
MEASAAYTEAARVTRVALGQAREAQTWEDATGNAYPMHELSGAVSGVRLARTG